MLPRRGSILSMWRWSVLGLTSLACLLAVALHARQSMPSLRCRGRCLRQGETVILSWGVSGVVARFRGSALAAEMEGLEPHNRWPNQFDVELDGAPQPPIDIGPGRQRLWLARDLGPGAHSLRLTRRNEALLGEVAVHRLLLGPEGAWLAPPPPLRRQIEVVGDSISAGYGNLGADARCHFSAATQDGARAYGPLAAAALGAEVSVIAYSGRGLWQNRDGSRAETMPVLYRRTLAERPAPLYQEEGTAPQAVVVNLGTNDFATGPVDRPAFAAAAGDFLAEIRRRRPRASIWLTLGPMLSDRSPAGQNQLSAARALLQAAVAARHATGDGDVEFLEFAEQDGRLGFGCDYHPSLATHAAMARQLSARIAARLDWPHHPATKGHPKA